MLQGDCGKFDPQTEADRASQKCIIGSLLKIYPALNIIGEEEVCCEKLFVFLHVGLYINVPEKEHGSADKGQPEP